jgi:hypothetical protein
VLEAIQAAKGRITIATEVYWLSADQRIYVEHGHQIGREVNCFKNWPTPFIEEGGLKYLERPWGEQFVQEFYNEYELKYPIIDNISSEQEGIRYGLATEGQAGVARGVQNFFKFFLFKVSWDQFAQVLGEEGEPPGWDVKTIREHEGDRFLIESLPKGDPFRTAAMEALKENKLQLSLKDLSDDEIIELCDKRAALLKMGEDITECPRERGTLGAVAETLLRSRNEIYADHLENTYKLLALLGKTRRRFEVFLYGHTHRADSGFYPLKGNWNPLVMNMGAWQRVVTPEQLKEITKAEGLSPNEILPTLEPEKLPACYSMIMIEPYTQQQGPKPHLLYWRENKEGVWGFSDWCDWSPKPRSIP